MGSEVSQTANTEYFRKYALKCFDNGWSSMKVPEGEKKAFFKNWNAMEIDRQKLNSWVNSKPKSNVGLRTGRTLIGVDVDTLAKGDDTAETQARALEFALLFLACLMKMFGDDILIRRNGTGDSRFLVPLRCSNILRRSTIKFSRADYPGEEHHIEILGVTAEGKHHQFVGFGYREEDGGVYCWDNDQSPVSTHIDDTAECSHEDLTALFGMVKKIWAEVSDSAITIEPKSYEKFELSVMDESDITNVAPIRSDVGARIGSMKGVDLPYSECELMLEFVLQVLGYDDEPYSSAFLPVQMAWHDYVASKGIPNDEGLATFLKYVRFGRHHQSKITSDWGLMKTPDVFKVKDLKLVDFETILKLRKEHKDAWEEFSKGRAAEISKAKTRAHLIKIKAWSKEFEAIEPNDEAAVQNMEDKLDLIADDIREDKSLLDSDRKKKLESRFKLEYRKLNDEGNTTTLSASELKEHLYPEPAPKEKLPDIATRLFNELMEQGELYRNEDEVVFIDLVIDGQLHTYPVHVQAFRNRLMNRARQMTGDLTDDKQVDNVCRNLEAAGSVSANIVETWVRVGYAPKDSLHSARLFYDLYDDQGRVIEITGGAWKVLSADQQRDIPVRLVRGQHGKPMPVPIQVGEGGLIEALDELWRHINVPVNMRDVMLTYLVDSLMPHTQHAILNLLADEGSGKSYGVFRAIRELVDCRGKTMNIAPKIISDLDTVLQSDYLSDLDNASKFTVAMQDNLIAAADNGALSTRRLYKDGVHIKLKVAGPVAATTIESGLFTRSDIQSRLLTIHIEKPTGEKYAPNELWVFFKAAQPRLFGALLTLTAKVLEMWDELPRSDDGHRHVSLNRVCAGVLRVQGKEGSLAELMSDTRERVLIDSQNDHPMLLELQYFIGMSIEGEIVGTSKAILDRLIVFRTNRGLRFTDSKIWTDRQFTAELSHAELAESMGLKIDKVKSGAKRKQAFRFRITRNEYMPSASDWYETASAGYDYSDDFDDLPDESDKPKLKAVPDF